MTTLLTQDTGAYRGCVLHASLQSSIVKATNTALCDSKSTWQRSFLCCHRGSTRPLSPPLLCLLQGRLHPYCAATEGPEGLSRPLCSAFYKAGYTLFVLPQGPEG
eukprot:1160577-Pelagomonas_calceolata.AAC.1